mmetsp:Transcript_8402/g.23358  ORF Transcript_8402/g.23358 Transcript_8402/m.23358 type:complete len:203 (-) Transcript_8402:795-1403(-)
MPLKVSDVEHLTRAVVHPHFPPSLLRVPRDQRPELTVEIVPRHEALDAHTLPRHKVAIVRDAVDLEAGGLTAQWQLREGDAAGKLDRRHWDVFHTLLLKMQLLPGLHKPVVHLEVFHSKISLRIVGGSQVRHADHELLATVQAHLPALLRITPARQGSLLPIQLPNMKSHESHTLTTLETAALGLRQDTFQIISLYQHQHLR